MERRFILGFLCLILVSGLGFAIVPMAQAQDGVVMTAEPEEPSGGSEMLHQATTGRALVTHSLLNEVPLLPASSLSFLGFDYDDNATENGGVHMIPPDPIGAAGIDRLIAVVNSMIEARDKIGTSSPLWRDSLEDFFTSLTPANRLFDPKVIYDHYENRFLVVALEKVDAGTNPNAGNTSRILLAVSKTATPATATTADWYYVAINSEEQIGVVDHWADYPGFEVDEEAVYVTGHMFAHTGGATDYGVRLWIVDKDTSAGFYAGGAAAVTKHDPYAGGGIAVTTMPAQVYGSGGIGGSGGTYLVSYSGLTDGSNEAVQVVRVNDPLGTPTFAGEYVVVGDIEDFSGSLPDAPQFGSATLIEVNDRRVLDAVWRNDQLWLTTTIDPNSGPDAGQTTAHWFRLNTSAAPGGAITLSDQGNIGGEDIADGTYTYFPSIAMNNNGDVMFGFSASAATIYAGAYVTGRLAGDPAGTVQSAETVWAGVDYYVRTFGGSKNRWGDYSGAALDPLDDNVVWIFNEYAMSRGSGTPPEDGRWGTAWAKNLFQSTSVTTTNATGIGIISATLNGNLADLGGYGSANVSFVWGTPSGNFTEETNYQVMTSTGNFSDNISGLLSNTNYYFKAKVIAGGTTEYGNELSFTTKTLVSITIIPDGQVLTSGRTQQFTATGNCSDNSTDNITGGVSWISDNTSVAVIDVAGLATSAVAGNTTISATLGEISSNTTLSVMASVEVNSGDTIALTESGLPGGSRGGIPLDIKGIPYLGPSSGVSEFIFDLSWDSSVIQVDNITAANIIDFDVITSTANNTTGTANVSGLTAGSYITGNTTVVATLGISAMGTTGESTSINATLTKLIDNNSDPVQAISINATVDIVTVVVEISVVLQGTRSSADHMAVPLQADFYTPNPSADKPNAVDLIYSENQTTVKTGTTTAAANFTGVAPGTYDITVFSEHTMVNYYQDVEITAPYTFVNMGTLQEGDCNNNGFVNLADFFIFLPSFGESDGDSAYNPMADFNRGGFVNLADFFIFLPNFGDIGPFDVTP
ncbi:Ig-like domain-containing protein [Chloroflexota bacterium]